MLRSILVGLDGSDFSESAVELGIDWARRHNALLVGVGVATAESPAATEPVSATVGALDGSTGCIGRSTLVRRRCVSRTVCSALQ